MKTYDTAKVYASRNVLTKLTGQTVSTDYRPLWAVSEDTDGLFLRTDCDHRDDMRILASSEILASDVASLASTLYAMPNYGCSVVDLDAKENLFVTEQSNSKIPRISNTVLRIELGHGMVLSAWNPLKQLQLRDIENFLGDGMSWLKQVGKERGRDSLRILPYVDMVPSSNDIASRLELSSQSNGNVPLKLDAWIRATISAYSAATTASDLGNDLNLVFEYIGESDLTARSKVRSMNRQERLLFTFSEIVKRHLIYSQSKSVA